ncbi:MAG: hypothetical protein HY599_00700 [Candidatus Omnitrophica bacterium]|nr:hypothetical protein [Candidatus Omnitrophota bacterium]
MSKVLNAVQHAAMERETRLHPNPSLWHEAQRVEASIVNWNARPHTTLEQAIARCETQIRECEQQATERAAQLETLKAQAADAAQRLTASEWARDAHRNRLDALEACQALSQKVSHAEQELDSLRAQLHQALRHADVTTDNPKETR